MLPTPASSPGASGMVVYNASGVQQNAHCVQGTVTATVPAGGSTNVTVPLQGAAAFTTITYNVQVAYVSSHMNDGSSQGAGPSNLGGTQMRTSFTIGANQSGTYDYLACGT